MSEELAIRATGHLVDLADLPGGRADARRPARPRDADQGRETDPDRRARAGVRAAGHPHPPFRRRAPVELSSDYGSSYDLEALADMLADAGSAGRPGQRGDRPDRDLPAGRQRGPPTAGRKPRLCGGARPVPARDPENRVCNRQEEGAAVTETAQRQTEGPAASRAGAAGTAGARGGRRTATAAGARRSASRR